MADANSILITSIVSAVRESIGNTSSGVSLALIGLLILREALHYRQRQAAEERNHREKIEYERSRSRSYRR